MKILQVTPAFAPAAHWGGFAESVPGLCAALARNKDLEIKVLTTDSDNPKTRCRIAVPAFPVRFEPGYDVYFCRRRWAQSVSLGLLGWLWKLAGWADVVHLTAAYSFPTIPTLLVCKLRRKPVVWSPRGALQRWQGTTRKSAKTAWEKVCNALCDPRRVVLHVTSEEEAAESLPRVPRTDSRVIPNGIAVPNLNGDLPQRKGALRLLYLGRLHPIKGIENLLRAMAQVRTDVTLSVCGDGERAYRRALEALATELAVDHKVNFCGRIAGEAKQQQFRQSDLCVVPSFKENFSLVVAESLAHGVPVIVSDGTPWKRVNDMGCGRCVTNDPEELARAIDELSMASLGEMGRRGRTWMTQEFSWDSVAANMIATYRTLVERNFANPPAAE